MKNNLIYTMNKKFDKVKNIEFSSVVSDLHMVSKSLDQLISLIQNKYKEYLITPLYFYDCEKENGTFVEIIQSCDFCSSFIGIIAYKDKEELETTIKEINKTCF